jgi:light-regulated signal transduction histidine kinase (bacteriophytochrome)
MISPNWRTWMLRQVHGQSNNWIWRKCARKRCRHLPDLEAAGLEVEVAIPDAPVWAQLSPGKLDRVMDNLLTTARDYGASGGWPDVRVNRAGANIARVEVIDRGSGIAVADRAHVFERFYRADGSPAAAAGGRGLGLAIARGIVLRHDGQIGLDCAARGRHLRLVRGPAAARAICRSELTAQLAAGPRRLEARTSASHVW